MFSKKNKGKYDYWIKWEYYVEKTPLYLRNGKVDEYKNFFSFLESTFDTLCELEETPYEILNNTNYKNTSGKNVNELVFSKNTPEYVKLKYYWNKIHKENEEITPQLINHNYYYYQSMIKDLGIILSRPIKKSWEQFLNLYNIRYKVKFKNVNDEITMLLSEELDEITKIIFRDIFEIKNIEIKNFDDVYDVRDKRNVSFDEGKFDIDYYYETTESFEDNTIYD